MPKVRVMRRRKRRPAKARTPVNRGGEMLLDWLRDTACSQDALAERVGVKQTTVGRWIGGIVPQVDVAARIEAETGVPVRAWAEPVLKRAG